MSRIPTAPERHAEAVALIPARRCVVCRSPQRGEIEGYWLQGHSLKAVSDEFTALSYGVILRHWSEGHPGETLGAEWTSIYAARALLVEIRVLMDETRAIFVRQVNQDKDADAVKTVLALTRLAETIGKVTGDIRPGEMTVNVNVGSEAAARMVGAANELELAEEYERRAKMLRERHAEKLALEARSEQPGVVDAEWSEAVPVAAAPVEPAP